MKTIRQARKEDINQIAKIDSGVIGNDSRREYIFNAIHKGQCLVAKEGDAIAGFLLYDTRFFDCTFISLIIVAEDARRKGHASALMDELVSTAPTEKVFSSTNQSNVEMQKVFAANGFVQSGMVENLDEGDPELIYFRTKGEGV
ncbi:GNAT family N-acetyltransferase [Falsibacillus albus]|uniref:GNAT family N-acetyltransferase n=1 Tax=Falsibacillus albus TaxID=2478915 RepID=A0A3L7JRR7_9BACI|nr:GNAT family N-acetyltransferase [Falsibacillus albus]RLQ92401.1 GNAT family N-acetyltransferase [Falsibacillus albus]